MSNKIFEEQLNKLNEAQLDAVTEIYCDPLVWMREGWLDYLSPQLYWRISPRKQSYSALLEWWREQGSRPVWPGIATTRIQSSEDPGRPASEIINQIDLSRKIGSNWVGHIHWSVKGLMKNQGGISTQLSKTYTQPVATPPMPWISKTPPQNPTASASVSGNKTSVRWATGNTTSKVAIQARNGGNWRTVAIVPAGLRTIEIPRADAIAISALDRTGNASPPKTLGLR